MEKQPPYNALYLLVFFSVLIGIVLNKRAAYLVNGRIVNFAFQGLCLSTKAKIFKSSVLRFYIFFSFTVTRSFLGFLEKQRA